MYDKCYMMGCRPSKLEDLLRPALSLRLAVHKLPEAMSVSVTVSGTPDLQLVYWDHSLVERDVARLYHWPYWGLGCRWRLQEQCKLYYRLYGIMVIWC